MDQSDMYMLWLTLRADAPHLIMDIVSTSDELGPLRPDMRVSFGGGSDGTLLLQALEMDKPKVFEMLLQIPVDFDLNETFGDQRTTYLQLAAQKQNPLYLRLLLGLRPDRGLDVNLATEDSPIGYAKIIPTNFVELLRDARIDPSVRPPAFSGSQSLNMCQRRSVFNELGHNVRMLEQFFRERAAIEPGTREAQAYRRNFSAEHEQEIGSFHTDCVAQLRMMEAWDASERASFKAINHEIKHGGVSVIWTTVGNFLFRAPGGGPAKRRSEWTVGLWESIQSKSWKIAAQYANSREDPMMYGAAKWPALAGKAAEEPEEMEWE